MSSEDLLKRRDSMSLVTISSSSPWLQRLDDPAQSKEIIDAIKSTVAKGASDVQLFMFIEIAKASGLNPFLKEIWWIPANGGQPMIAEDGWQKICNNNPAYDGSETEFSYADDGKTLVSCTVKIWRKDRKLPAVGVARWDEYGKSEKESSAWKYRHAMLENRAFCLAARRAFPVSGGLYTEDEIQSVVGTPISPLERTGYYGVSPQTQTAQAEEAEEAEVVGGDDVKGQASPQTEEKPSDEGNELGKLLRSKILGLGYSDKNQQDLLIRKLCVGPDKISSIRNAIASADEISSMRLEMQRLKQTEEEFVAKCSELCGRKHKSFFEIMCNPEDIPAYAELFK